MTDSWIDRDSRRNFAPGHDFSFLFVISQILPQGKFWAYHDLLYANAPKAGPEHLKAFAQEVGLNLPAFEQCVSSGKYRAAVQKDVEGGGDPGPLRRRSRQAGDGTDKAQTSVPAVEGQGSSAVR